MRDVDTIKQRIEAAEKHIASAELARNRECDELMKMWLQIRDRFTAQEDQITGYRVQLEEMTQKNSELGLLVDTLLATIEGNLDRARDETVSRITNLAEELLASEPSAFATAKSSENQTEISATETSSFKVATPAASAPDEAAKLETVAKQVGNAPNENVVPDPDDIQSVLDQIAADVSDIAAAEPEIALAEIEIAAEESDDDDADHPEIAVGAPEIAPMDEINEDPQEGDSLNEGIRSIITKIEGMNSTTEAPEVDTPDDKTSEPKEFLSELLGALKGSDEIVEKEPDVQEDAELQQELREIETLRDELTGLRDRLSHGDDPK